MAHTNTAVCRTAIVTTAASERRDPPIPSQSTTGFVVGSAGGYSVVRTTYMLANVAALMTTYAIRHRNEIANRMAPSAKNGKP